MAQHDPGIERLGFVICLLLGRKCVLSVAASSSVCSKDAVLTEKILSTGSIAFCIYPSLCCSLLTMQYSYFNSTVLLIFDDF